MEFPQMRARRRYRSHPYPACERRGRADLVWWHAPDRSSLLRWRLRQRSLSQVSRGGVGAAFAAPRPHHLPQRPESSPTIPCWLFCWTHGELGGEGRTNLTGIFFDLGESKGLISPTRHPQPILSLCRPSPFS